MILLRLQKYHQSLKFYHLLPQYPYFPINKKTGGVPINSFPIPIARKKIFPCLELGEILVLAQIDADRGDS